MIALGSFREGLLRNRECARFPQLVNFGMFKQRVWKTVGIGARIGRPFTQLSHPVTTVKSGTTAVVEAS